MNKLHLIQSDKHSSLYHDGEILRLGYDRDSKNFYQMYITSFEDLNHGDFCLRNNDEVHYVTKGSNFSKGNKILLTTDSWCRVHGVQNIDDNFLEWFIQNIDCTEVDVVTTDMYRGGVGMNYNFVYKIIIPSQVTFEQAVRPLMKWLSENSNPHATAIVTCRLAELVEGMRVFKTDEFLID